MEILNEATVLGFGGSYEPRPERYGEVITTDTPQAEFSITEPGNYRVYVYCSTVRDTSRRQTAPSAFSDFDAENKKGGGSHLTAAFFHCPDASTYAADTL